MTRLETDGGMARLDSFLMSIAVQQRPGIQIQSVAVLGTGQPTQGPLMQTIERVAGELIKGVEKTAQRRLTGYLLDPHDGRNRWVTAQMRHSGKLVGSAQDTSH